MLQGKNSTGNYCKAVVIRTGKEYHKNLELLTLSFFTKLNGSMTKTLSIFKLGFMTTKGELVRSILFPPPLDFKFHRDFIRSIGVFLSMGLVGMTYSLYMWHRNGVSSIPINFQSLLDIFNL